MFSRTTLALYVPTRIHLFPHARTDTIQVVEHEPNFSKFYPLTISFLVSQFCTLESSLCVSSSDYYLISPFGSSLIKVVLNPKIRTTECTHQTTSVHRMNSWLITMWSMCQPNHRSTRNKGIEQVCYPVKQDHSEQYCAWTLNPSSVHSIIYWS